jgi:hypothetical protein
MSACEAPAEDKFGYSLGDERLDIGSWDANDRSRSGCPSHAPRDFEEQPAAERDAERPEDEGTSVEGH